MATQKKTGLPVFTPNRFYPWLRGSRGTSLEQNIQGNRNDHSRHKGRVPQKRIFSGVTPQGRGVWRVETGMSSLALPLKKCAFAGSRRPPVQSRVIVSVAAGMLATNELFRSLADGFYFQAGSSCWVARNSMYSRLAAWSAGSTCHNGSGLPESIRLISTCS